MQHLSLRSILGAGRVHRFCVLVTFYAVSALQPFSALADARSPQVEPFMTPSVNPAATPAPPTIQIEAPQQGSNGGGRASARPPPPGVSAATNAGQLAAGDLAAGVSPCTADPFKSADAAATSTTASRELERLRSTALATIPTSPQKPLTARQQRLQANAAWQMGLLTLHGICVVLNTADAQVWFELAQRLGEPLAPAGLAWCEMAGCKAAANPTAARKWLAQLYSTDTPRALYLQWLLQTKLAPLELIPFSIDSVQKREMPLRGRQLLTEAARRGDTNAQIELGLDSVAAGDVPGAVAFFTSAAARSAAASSNALLLSQRLRKVGPQSSAVPSGTVNTQSQSAEDNLLQAQRYHRGAGVPANYTEAIRLYQLAQNQGSMAAKKMLALIFSRPAANGDIDVGWMQQLGQVGLSGAAPPVNATVGGSRLKREPTPLFELVPNAWRKFVASSIGA